MTLNVDELRAEARGGSTVAQAVLGCLLLETKRDPVEALQWLSSASARGVPRAMFYLGTMYEEGLVVSADPERARSLYEAAAKRGEFYACIFLARLLGSGKCGSADEAVALHWYAVAVSHSESVIPCPELEEARAFINARTGNGAG
ncbi:MAG: tetratricopeptide repeat protein [Vicinamibacteria bacterium]